MARKISALAGVCALALAAAGSAHAADSLVIDFESGGYTLAGDGGGSATLSSAQFVSPGNSAQLMLPNGATDFAKVIVDGSFGPLGGFTGSFSAYVPTGNDRADLFPYMYVGVDSNQNGVFDFTGGPTGDSFVILFEPSGANPLGTWYVDGLDATDTVHVVGGRQGLAALDYSSSNGGGLMSSLFGENGSAWGGYDVLQVRVGAGEWPNGGAYTAFVDDISVPEPASMALLGMGLLGLRLVRRRR